MKDKINRNKANGKCDFCETVDVAVIDARELSFAFQSIFDLYSPKADGKSAPAQLLNDFQDLIFSTSNLDGIDKLLRAIFANDESIIENLIDKNISLTCIEDPLLVKEVDSLQLTWDNFVNEIKAINRFHIKSLLDFEKLKKLLSIYEKIIPKGKLLYRGRISDATGFSKDHIWNPPNHLAKSGRANPVGISYLYLASDLNTTLFETRAGLHDYVTVGEFRCIENTRVIDLKEVDRQDPFDVAQVELLQEYVIFLPFLKRLGHELSKPVRRQDSELDYLPTQYLTEFIKSIVYDGISYGSSLNKVGQNFAIFDRKFFECINVGVYEITDIEYNHNLVV